MRVIYILLVSFLTLSCRYTVREWLLLIKVNKGDMFLFSFTHVTLCCLVVHYAVESINHAMRLLQISGKDDVAKNL